MSGLTEGLWELPTSWQWATMGGVADVIGGGTPSTANPDNFGGSVPWITPADMSTHVGKTISHGARSISEQGLDNSGARRLPKGSVLFSSRAPIGYVAVAAQPVTTNQGFKSFVPESGITSDFVYYWLTSAKPLAEKLASGTTFLEISGAKAALVPFPVAPTAEQTRIVEKLEELLSDLDAGVAELKAAQKKLGQYRQSLLKAAVEGALTCGWRAKNTVSESGAQLLARILTERRARWEAKQLAKFAEQGKAPPKDWQKKYPEPVQPDTRDLPELPEGWVWASVEQLATLVSGHTPKDAGDMASSDGEVDWFKVGDMNQPGNEEWMTVSGVKFTCQIADELGMKLVPMGTIIFPKRGGAIATNKKRRLSVAACYDLNTMGLIPMSGIGEWLWWWFSGVDLGRLSDGSNVPQINNPDIAPLCVPIPPVDEIEAIISFLKSAIEGAVQQEVMIEKSLKQSAAQRKNILKDAFSGQLVPQDANDEPASVLLERIRAERAEREKQPKVRKTKERCQ